MDDSNRLCARLLHRVPDAGDAMTILGVSIWKWLIAWLAVSVIVSLLTGLIFEDRLDKWLSEENQEGEKDE